MKVRATRDEGLERKSSLEASDDTVDEVQQQLAAAGHPTVLS